MRVPQGWSFSGTHAGIKENGTPDLALLVSDRPAAVAAAFTPNKATCAHIFVCRPRVSAGVSRGVVVTSGNANAATGRAGIERATELARAAADACGVDEEQMLVCSTGKIGIQLPMDAISQGIETAAKALSTDGLEDAARAIWTTDTKLKISIRTVGDVTVSGIAKGAAMIAPALVPHATMLAFLVSDAVATPEFLRSCIADALPTTFNAITTDGSMSTNDTVLLFANGASGVNVDGSDAFATAVSDVMSDLAYAIASDGEGCTKVIRVRITGAASPQDARAGAEAVANSILLRSAIWAGEAKWGWVVQQLGQVPIELDPDRIRVSIAGVELAVDGQSTGREAEANGALDRAEVVVEATLGLGDGAFEFLTCDITPDFPKLQLST